MASAIEYPPITNNSRALSNDAVSDWPSSIIGQIFSRSFSLNNGDARFLRRAFIQFIFPLTVLISPLWHSILNGCARLQVGKVFVENR